MQNEQNRELFEVPPEESIWDTRRDMMSEEEVRELSEEKGKGAEGAVRADQSGQPGYQPGGDPGQRADMEGGVSGRLERKNAKEYEDVEQTDAKDWQKYDWA